METWGGPAKFITSFGISQKAKLESKNRAHIDPTQKYETDRDRFRQKTWASRIESSRKDNARNPKSATRNPMKKIPNPAPKACWLAKNSTVPPRTRLAYRPPRVRRSKLDIPSTKIKKCPTGIQSPFNAATVSDRIQTDTLIMVAAMSNARTRDWWWRQRQLVQWPVIPRAQPAALNHQLPPTQANPKDAIRRAPKAMDRSRTESSIFDENKLENQEDIFFTI